MIEPRKAIPGGEWRVTIQLEVDGEPVGSPLHLRYVDTAIAGGTKTKKPGLGVPEDFGYLISSALCEYASKLKPPKRRKK